MHHITVFTEVASQLSGNLRLFCTQLYKVFNRNKIENVTVKNYLEESLLSILCFIIHGQGSSEKGILNCKTGIYLIAVVSCLHDAIKVRRIFCLL